MMRVVALVGAVLAVVVVVTPTTPASESISTLVAGTVEAHAIQGATDAPDVSMPQVLTTPTVPAVIAAPGTTLPYEDPIGPALRLPLPPNITAAISPDAEPGAETVYYLPGYIELDLSIVSEDADPVHRAGDRLEWTLTATNVSFSTLWGTYVYLERHGRVLCDVRRLEPGEVATCTLETSAVVGDHPVEAWVTAWTTEDLVAFEYTGLLEVSPRRDAGRHPVVVDG